MNISEIASATKTVFTGGYGEGIQHVAGAAAIALGAGLYDGSFGTASTVFGTTMGGSAVGHRFGAKYSVLGGVIGAGLGYGSSALAGGGAASVALGAMATSVGISAKYAGSLRGGMFYNDYIRGIRKAGITDAQLKTLFEPYGMDILGPTGLYTDVSTMAGSLKNMIWKGQKPGEGARILSRGGYKIADILSKKNMFTKYVDAYIGSPALAKAATQAGGINNVSGINMTKALGQDLLESIPAALVLGGATWAGNQLISNKPVNKVKSTLS